MATTLQYSNSTCFHEYECKAMFQLYQSYY